MLIKGFFTTRPPFGTREKAAAGAVIFSCARWLRAILRRHAMSPMGWNPAARRRRRGEEAKGADAAIRHRHSAAIMPAWSRVGSVRAIRHMAATMPPSFVCILRVRGERVRSAIFSLAFPPSASLPLSAGLFRATARGVARGDKEAWLAETAAGGAGASARGIRVLAHAARQWCARVCARAVRSRRGGAIGQEEV